MTHSGNMEKFIKVSLERFSVGRREAYVISPGSLGCKTLFDLVFFSLFYFLVRIQLLTTLLTGFVCAENQRWMILVCTYYLISSAKCMLFVSFPWFLSAFQAKPWMTIDIWTSRLKKIFFTCWKYPEREAENRSLWNTWQSTWEIDARNASIAGKFHLKLSCF